MIDERIREVSPHFPAFPVAERFIGRLHAHDVGPGVGVNRNPGKQK
jgi:hypothetical protein